MSYFEEEKDKRKKQDEETTTPSQAEGDRETVEEDLGEEGEEKESSAA